MRVRSTVSVRRMGVGGARLGSSQWGGGKQGRKSTSWESWRRLRLRQRKDKKEERNEGIRERESTFNFKMGEGET